MELLDLYDDNGNKLGKTIERGKKFDEGNIMLALAFIKNSSDEYLIQKTSKEKGSKYSLTGGHVVHNEKALTTIIREIEEELGLLVNENDIEFISLEKHPEKPALFNIFLVNKDVNINDLKLQKEEVEKALFLTKDKVLDLIDNDLFHESHAYFFKKYIDKGMIK